jgi:predicted GTPase
MESDGIAVGVRRVVIMGAAGRDFHVFNTVYRSDASLEVVAFTAAQIPGIADRRYPAELAGAHYPRGIPIVPEAELETLIERDAIDTVVFAYSDVSHESVMHAASRTLAAGADFTLLGPDRTMLASRLPVIAVCATRTGAGKSQTSRRVATIVEQLGHRPVVVRHPMPYGDLVRQRVQRFADYEDLAREQATIEEREEYEPHIEAGRTVFAGVDYLAVLRAAEQEGDVIIWDGGNNDLPFFRHDLLIAVTDPLRPGDETRYHPGEAVLRRADFVIINKVDSAEREAVDALREVVGSINPRAAIAEARSEVRVDGDIGERRVVIVEDGPTLTHGGMRFGAGIVAARRAGAYPVDPRPYAVGSIRETLTAYPDLDSLVPAMGYGPAQVADLRATLEATPADLVLAATPIDIGRLLQIEKPVVRVRYELGEVEGEPLERAIARCLSAMAATAAVG